MAIKARFPLLLMLLGIVFLALVCVSSGVRHPCHEKCLKRCNSVNEASKRQECHSRCVGWPERCEEEEEEDERPWHKEPGRRERGRQEGEREEEEQHPGRRERGRQEGEREEDERQHRQPRPQEEEEEHQQPSEKRQQRREREDVGQLQHHEEREERQHRQSRHQEEEEGQPQHEREQDERQHSQSRHQEEEERQQQHPGQRQPRHEREQEERHRQSRHQEEEEGQQRPEQRQPRHEREREEQQQSSEQQRPRHEQEQEEEEEWQGRHRHEDPEERERARLRRERRQEVEEGRGQRHRHRESEEEEEGSSSESQRRRRHRESEEEEEGSSSSESQRRRNPFFFSSNTFQTLLENENGRIRLLQRFDKRSNLFQNLKNYRLLEYRSRPHTLFLPQHIDADSILIVLNGRAIFTVVNPDNRNSFNLERGDAIRLPAGTTAYLANQDDNEDLRVIDLAIPVNRPGQFQSFFPSSSQKQQSYFNEFSRDILEASFNTNYKEIERVLLEDQHDRRQQRRERQQSQEVNLIVKVSREQIEELKRNAKSSSKKSSSSESQPFNLRSRDPIYSNKFGRFFEITPEKNPQLQDLSLSLSSVEIREGAIFLPHYNSRAFVILVVNEGKGYVELVAQRNEQQQQGEEDEDEEEDERSGPLQRYSARLSSGDVFVIPSSNPVAVNASSDLNFIGFGINAENNERNFLAGEEDNVISQIHRPVKELAFPGSAQEVERLIKNLRQSHFASAQPQQREEGSQKRRGPLSSILDVFY